MNENKVLIFVISIIAVAFIFILSGYLIGQQQTNQVDNEFFEKIPVIDAYYNGEKVWFIHTDVTDEAMAERLTKMVNYRTIYAPKNAEVVDIDKLAKLYVFTNGINKEGEEPWDGGPFNYQIDIFDSVPGDDDYTSVRNPSLVAWNEDATPRVLKSMSELLDAEANGELTIKKTPIVVNVPMVRWPGGGSKIS